MEMKNQNKTLAYLAMMAASVGLPAMNNRPSGANGYRRKCRECGEMLKKNQPIYCSEECKQVARWNDDVKKG